MVFAGLKGGHVLRCFGPVEFEHLAHVLSSVKQFDMFVLGFSHNRLQGSPFLHLQGIARHSLAT